MIHMLTAAIITDTNDTLSFFIYQIPLIGSFSRSWTFHPHVNVESDSGHNAQTCEDYRADYKACLFCHFIYLGSELNDLIIYL